MADEISDISSVSALLKDARERIKESELRSKESLDRTEERLQTRIDELERQHHTLNLDLSKWTPLLTQLQKSDENKRNMTVLLIVSFITNIATIIMSIFIWFIKSGGGLIK